MSIPTGNCTPPPASVYFAPIRLNYPTADEALNSVLGPGPVITMSGLVIISSMGDRLGRQCWSSRPPANRLINGRIFVLRLIITVYSPLWRWSGCQPAHCSLATPGLFHAPCFLHAPFYSHAELWVCHAYSCWHAQIHAFSMEDRILWACFLRRQILCWPRLYFLNEFLGRNYTRPKKLISALEDPNEIFEQNIWKDFIRDFAGASYVGFCQTRFNWFCGGVESNGRKSALWQTHTRQHP